MLGFGVVGTNFISDWFVSACRASGVAEPVAVLSRDAGRGAEFATRHGVGAAVCELDELLALDEVQAVYVASPIAAHHDQVTRSLAAGRHVLGEKTLCATLTQTAEVLASARDRGLVLAEAVRPLFDPDFLLVAQHLERLGAIRHVRFEKQQYSSRYDRVKAGEHLNAFDPELANSAVADIGIYALAPVLYLFGTPDAATGSGVFLDNGFEAAGALLLDYPGSVVNVTWSKITQSSQPSCIHGELGTMVIDQISGPSRIVIEWRTGGTEILLDKAVKSDADNMPDEIRAFVERVRTGTPDERREQVTLDSRRLIDEYLRHHEYPRHH